MSAGADHLASTLLLAILFEIPFLGDPDRVLPTPWSRRTKSAVAIVGQGRLKQL
jgi:hypothetical protein